MNCKSLGLLALLLLNLAAEASVFPITLNSVPSADDTTLDLVELVSSAVCKSKSRVVCTAISGIFGPASLRYDGHVQTRHRIEFSLSCSHESPGRTGVVS